MCSVGVKYKSYCASLTRTWLVDPAEQVERNYKFVVALFSLLLSALKPGVVCKTVYNSIVTHVSAKRPDLVDGLSKNFGFGMGLEFKDPWVIGFVLLDSVPNVYERFKSVWFSTPLLGSLSITTL